jgi:hypothetical protein
MQIQHGAGNGIEQAWAISGIDFDNGVLIG